MEGINCIAFDIDHTLIRYNLPNLFTLTSKCICQFMVEVKSFDPSLLVEINHDFLQNGVGAHFLHKGLIIDKKWGNVVKIDEHKRVIKARHGLHKHLTALEIQEIYPAPLDINVSSPFTPQFFTIVTYFEAPVTPIFAYLVDKVDQATIHGTENEAYKKGYQHISDSMLGAFEAHFGHYRLGNYYSEFRSENVQKYVYKANPNLVSWLKEIRLKGTKILLISNALTEYAYDLLNYCFGEDYLSLFDVVIMQAMKPNFFRGSTKFVVLDPHEGVKKEAVEVDIPDLVSCSLFAKGNISALLSALTAKHNGEEIKLCYVGDSLTGDIVVPKMEISCMTVAIVEELENEHHILLNGMNPSHVANNHGWGPFFCGHSETQEEVTEIVDGKLSLFGRMITQHSDICCGSVDDLIQFLVSEPPLLSPCKILHKA